MSAPNGSDFAALGIHVRMDGPTEQRVPCPRCDRPSRDDALGVNLDSGAFHCFRCNWRGRVGGRSTEPGAPRVQRREPDPNRAAKATERMQRIWEASFPLTASTAGAKAVRNYLSVRGLETILREPPACLRAHSALPYYEDGRQVGTYPALIAQVHGNNAAVVTLHQTFLKADGSGKAPVRAPKKLLPLAESGATRGGAIRLYEPTKERVLGVAEGIETALSLRLMQGIPVWSTVSATGMSDLYFPFVRELYIAVDIDESNAGEAAAWDLLRRARQKKPNPPRVIFVKPSGEKVPRDLNDELLERKRAQRCLN